MKLKRIVKISIVFIAIALFGVGLYFANLQGWFTQTFEDPGLFAHESSPAISLGDAGEWDELTVAQPSIVLRDGIYYLFYTGVGNRPDGTGRQTGIGYATSADGVTWQKSADNPILTSDEVGTVAIHNPEVIFYGNQWQIYFSVNEHPSLDRTNPNGVAILLAQSQSLAVPFVVQADPVFELSPDLSWYNWAVQPGSILPMVDDRLEMYFSGTSGPYSGAIGIAQQAAASDNAFADTHGIIFDRSEKGWDSGDVWGATVEPISGSQDKLMVYHGGLEHPRNSSLGLGLAISKDDENWQRHPANPVVILEDGYPQSPAMILRPDGEMLIFYTRRSIGGSRFDIGFSHGRIPPFPADG